MKVLFIGNSYTYFYDMPKLFEAECRERGAECDVDSVTAGGYTLEQFLSDGNEFGRRAKELLHQKKYDYVVMQEQSVRPASDPELFLDSLRRLMVFVRENGAKPVLYETWGRADHSDELTRLGWDHDLMQTKLNESYAKGAAEHGAAGRGKVWGAARSGGAVQGAAGPGRVWGAARHGAAVRGEAGSEARSGKARRGAARPGGEWRWQNRARQGRVCGMARRGYPRHCRARQVRGLARLGETGQGSARSGEALRG